MVLKKAIFAVKGYKLFSRFWDWWQTVVKAWKERDSMPVETVDGVKVRSAWLSKINWAAFGMILINAFELFGKSFSAEDQAQIVGLFSGDVATNWISIIVSVAVIIFRSFYNNTVTPKAAKP